jgi:hypothetical protein
LTLQKITIDPIDPVILRKIASFVKQISQVRLISQLEDIWSLILVNFKAFLYELLEKRVDIPSPPGIRNRSINVVSEVVLSLAELKWRVPVEHLEDGDAKRPDVSLLTVAVQNNSFG